MLDADNNSGRGTDATARRHMLDHLRQHIAATLAQARSATLATRGPAGLQAHVMQCAVSGIRSTCCFHARRITC